MTATQALRAAGFVHANRGPNRAHAIYSNASGELVAHLHAHEVWAWLGIGQVERAGAVQAPPAASSIARFYVNRLRGMDAAE